MTEDKFEKLKKEYRVISCFNEDLTKSDGSVMMFSKDFKTIIYPLDEKHCCLISWKNSKLVQEMIEGIPLKHCDIDTKEKSIVFEDKYLKEICERANIKKASQTPLKPSNIANVSYYLRVMRNVSDNYKEKLKEFTNLDKKVKPIIEKGGLIGQEIGNQRIAQINKNGSVTVVMKNGKRKLLTIQESEKLIKKCLKAN